MEFTGTYPFEEPPTFLAHASTIKAGRKHGFGVRPPFELLEARKKG